MGRHTVVQYRFRCDRGICTRDDTYSGRDIVEATAEATREGWASDDDGHWHCPRHA